MPGNMDGSFKSRVAFVTPGSGIGGRPALAFAREGASVVIAERSEKSNQETACIIEQLRGHALAIKCDVTRIGDVKTVLDKAVERFSCLDSLYFAFKNADSEQAITATADLTHQEWDRIVNMNVPCSIHRV